MNRDKETIYAYLLMKIENRFGPKLSMDEQVELDGVLWEIADVLCEKAPKVPIEKIEAKIRFDRR